MKRWLCRLRRRHNWDPMRDQCRTCRLTAEAIYRGRDKRPPRTWEEHDAAVEQAWRAGEEFGRLAAQLAMRERTRRAYRLGLRRMYRDVRRVLYGPGGERLERDGAVAERHRMNP